MTTEQQALALELRTLAAQADKTDDDIRYYSGGSKHNEVREKLNSLMTASLPAIILALEERGHFEAFRQEVSEAVKAFFDDTGLDRTGGLTRFIIAPPVDPLVEALKEAADECIKKHGRSPYFDGCESEYTEHFRAALATHGLQITGVET